MVAGVAQLFLYIHRHHVCWEVSWDGGFPKDKKFPTQNHFLLFSLKLRP